VAPVSTSTEDTALRQAEAVTPIELFFDLVYVFAVTQLSELLANRHTVDGAIQTAVLLALVWQIWVYTTWAVNYLDPNRDPARVMLIALMAGSLVLAAAVPEAFDNRGLLVAITYVAMQLGRVLFVIWALKGERLQIVFLRILPWTTVSSAVVLLGGFEHGHVRALLWAGAIVIDLIGAAFGFYVPGLGGSATTEWTISGAHFAERCQAFVLIALGESIIIIGRLLPIEHPTGHGIVAFGTAFAGAVALWWVYFDRAAQDSAHVIAASRDPGRLARSAFHWIHPLIIGGIIVTAAADSRVLHAPTARSDATTAWLVLGGAALFLAGHALFKAVVWRIASWPRIVAVVVLAAMGLLAPHVAGLTLAICTVAVVVAVAIADRVLHAGLGSIHVESTDRDDAQRTPQRAEDVG
jgi:low temperature requirement protein LtrA